MKGNADPSKLGFIHIDSEGKVILTKEGWDFAVKPNLRST